MVSMVKALFQGGTKVYQLKIKGAMSSKMMQFHNNQNS